MHSGRGVRWGQGTLALQFVLLSVMCCTALVNTFIGFSVKSHVISNCFFILWQELLRWILKWIASELAEQPCAFVSGFVYVKSHSYQCYLFILSLKQWFFFHPCVLHKFEYLLSSALSGFTNPSSSITVKRQLPRFKYQTNSYNKMHLLLLPQGLMTTTMCV